MKNILQKLYGFMLFFALVAFVTTCSLILFLQDFDLPDYLVAANAKYTFFNVIFLSFVLWIFDSLRRKITVERHIKRITKALEKIMAGDFTVQIPKSHQMMTENYFEEIIEGINKMTKELGSVETLRSDFISNVSHEFKTPLSIIQNYGTLLQDTSITDEEQLDYAKSIAETSRNLAKLIANILSLNKLENQQIFPQTENYNLSEQIYDSIISFENEINAKHLEIRTDIEEKVHINSDSELLRIVWNNLLSNAIKFTAEGGIVTVQVKSTGEETLISVKDTGLGMDSETGKHIFEKFYQGDNAHLIKGNGLGLALVKRIINILNGEIQVKSELGKGSEFTVRLKNEGEKH